MKFRHQRGGLRESLATPVAGEHLPKDQITEFLMLAQCGLVLRGHDNERSIPDPILRKVWRFGKKLNQQRALREKR